MIKFWFDNFKIDRASHRIRAKLIVDHAQQNNYDINIVGPNNINSINPNTDIVIFSKDSSISNFFKIKNLGCKVGFDVCDNKFETDPSFFDFCANADFITANTPTMQKIIKQNTNKDSFYFADCVEQPFQPPKTNFSDPLKLLWYGGKSSIGYMPWQRTIDNLQKNNIDFTFKVVTNSSQKFYEKALRRWNFKEDNYFDIRNLEFIEWTYEIQQKSIEWCDIIVIPVDRIINKKGDRTITKSHNRLVDGIASGRWVISSDLPSYQPLSNFCWLGEVAEGIDFFKNNKLIVEEKIIAGQKWITQNASAEVIVAQLIQIYKGIKNV